MLVWRGFGILVVVFLSLCFLGTEIAAEQLWGKSSPAMVRSVIVPVALLLAAVLVYLLHLVLARYAGARVHVDEATGERYTLREAHDLFFVPVKYWPMILGAGGALMLVFG
ncbi:hypothetical protein LE190_19610 [Massilia oculi]|uniref:Uncharacterized protein n=1 Tax=Massilia hydrophila TaxID=3044279 RepID=A0ABS7YEJ3_9BURK|nr:hypothetical protein [Massilia oculi]MCA1858119.1 hypothetical protein [Massilia oculi]